MADENLSDEQVRQLLKDAEERLRIKKGLGPKSSSLDNLQNSIPRLASQKTIEPYVKTTDHGASVDPSHLVTAEQRKSANGIRVVEDPVVVKAKAARYTTFSHIRTNSSMRKIIPKNPDAEFGPVLGTTLQPVMFIIHSYAEKISNRCFYLLHVLNAANLKREKKATAGAAWYNLPRTNLTPELKRDLQLLRMRDVLDPKRFYKKENSKPQIPEFSQVGTIIEGPTEYFSGRLSNKERKRTLVEEILAGEKETGRFKSKYQQIQEAKTSGKKAHYKKMVAMRKKGGSKG